VTYTHTFVVLEVTPTAYREIAEKLAAAGYSQAFLESEGRPTIDLHGAAGAAA
jgi:hypothetical protein